MELANKDQTDEARFYSTAEILADDDIRSLQTKLIDCQNRVHYLQGRLDQLQASGGGGGGMGGVNPMLLMAMQGGGGGGEGGEGSNLNNLAQLMMMQQNPALGMMAGGGGKVDLANPTAMLGGLQGGSSDLALSPMALGNGKVDPMALLALVQGKGELADLLEKELNLNSKEETLPPRMKKFFEPGKPKVVLKAKGVKLPKRIGLDKIDAFLRVKTMSGVVLHTTNQVVNTATPVWPAFDISTASTTMEAKLNFEVLDFQGNGKHRSLGCMEASLNDVIKMNDFPLSPVDLGDKKGKKVSGSLVITAEEKQGDMLPFAVTLNLACSDLDNRDGPGDLSDPFFAIYLDRPPQETTWSGVEAEATSVTLVEDDNAEPLGGPADGEGEAGAGGGEAPPKDKAEDEKKEEEDVPSDNDDEVEVQGEGKKKPFKEAPYDLREDLHDRGYLIYVSEVVMDNLSPNFQPARIDLTAIGGNIDIPIRIEFWDYDDDSRHDYLGTVHLSGFRQLMMAGAEFPVLSKRRKKLGQNRNNGMLRVLNSIPYKLPENRPQADPNFFRFQLSMNKLGHGRKLDVVGKGDPFFIIYGRPNPLGGEVIVYRSEIHKNTKTPQFNPCELEVEWVGGLDTPFRVVVYDWDPNYKMDYIGEINFTCRQLTWGHKDYFLQRRDKRSIVHYSGEVKIERSNPIIRKANFDPTHIELVLMFTKLRKKEITRNDVFFTVSFGSTVLYTSEVFMNIGSQACFKPFKLKFAGITRTTPLTIHVYDWNKNERHASIGMVTVTALELGCWENQSEYALWHAKKGERALFKSGLMKVVSFKEKLRGVQKDLKHLLGLIGIEEDQAVMSGDGTMNMSYVSAESASALLGADNDFLPEEK